jgi:multiple sugar transport system substrate-binding protein
MGPILAEFEAQNPGVKVNYVQQSSKDYRERLQSALARSEGPDIFRFHNTWVPMLKKDLDLLPGTIMPATEFEQTFYPVAVTDLKSGSSYLGIPLMIDGLGVYYNKTMLKAANKTPPSTWDELRKLASDLTVTTNGKIQRSGVAMGITSNVEHFPDILGLMLLQNGANPGNPTNSLATDALTFYTIFTKTDRDWNDTLPPSTFAFANEKTAMMIAPSWRANEVKQLNPKLDFAVVPVPQLPNTKVSWASYWVEGVSKKSKHTDVAWKLLKFLSTKETLRKLYTAESAERFIGEPFSRVDMADQLIGDPVVGAYIEQAPYASSWYLASKTFDNGLNDQIIKYYEDAINKVNSGTEAGSALSTVASGVQQVLTQYGLLTAKPQETTE